MSTPSGQDERISGMQTSVSRAAWLWRERAGGRQAGKIIFLLFYWDFFYILLILNKFYGKFRYFGSRKADGAISQFRPN
jgi:hypothetical protein